MLCPSYQRSLDMTGDMYPDLLTRLFVDSLDQSLAEVVQRRVSLQNGGGKQPGLPDCSSWREQRHHHPLWSQ